MRLHLFFAVAAASLALFACSKSASSQASDTASGAMPSGRYACDGGNSVDIRGAEYRGPTDEPSGEFSPYVMDAGNAVTWTAGFGEFSVVSTQYKGISQDSTAQPWFAVTYNRTHGGGVEQIDCERQPA